MRAKTTTPSLNVQAIAGTYVTLLGMDMPVEACDGLLGFAIHRRDHSLQRGSWLRGIKTFAETDPGLPAGSSYSTRRHPIQGFSWSDLDVNPGREYTYTVLALKGKPSRLKVAYEAEVSVQSESVEGRDHDIYFNRGSAASQEYARRFENRPPDEVGSAAFKWLSRGLYEAMCRFIDQAGAGDGLRVCAYEFHHEPLLKRIAAAARRGVDVRVLYDRRKEYPGEKNDLAVANTRLEEHALRRINGRSALSHNKFIVLLKSGTPDAVLTGSTNFSQSGIFGHSNVVHIVEDAATAQAYLAYWHALAADPASATLRPQVNAFYTIRNGLPDLGCGALFSPRSRQDALDFYALLGRSARRALFMTFAFGMHPLFQEVYAHGSAPLRYALLERTARSNLSPAERVAEHKRILKLRLQPENRFAVGAHLTLNNFDRWLREALPGLTTHVDYIHTKYMLVDPLSDDPILVSGSANFSKASCVDNDENMLVIRGNQRVADVYLGEFMRLYNHFAFREAMVSARHSQGPAIKNLRTDAWWRDYFGDTPRSRQRAYFAGAEMPSG